MQYCVIWNRIKTVNQIR